MSAVFLFSSMDTLAKYMLRTYPLPPLIWARYAVHMVFMLALLAPRMGFDLVRTTHPGLQILRGMLLVASTRVLLPVAHLPAAGGGGGDHVRRHRCWSPRLSGPMLGERITRRQWVAVDARLRRRAGHHPPGRRTAHAHGDVPAVSALLFAFYQIITRKLVGRENPLTTLFYTALVGTCRHQPGPAVHLADADAAAGAAA